MILGAHLRDRDPIGDTVAHEGPRSALADKHFAGVPVDRVAGNWGETSVSIPLPPSDNHLLTAGVEFTGPNEMVNPVAIPGRSWVNSTVPSHRI